MTKDDPVDEDFTRAGLDGTKGGNEVLLSHAIVILGLVLNVSAPG